MWYFIEPTRSKVKSALFILASFWLTTWLVHAVTVSYYEYVNPGYIDAVAEDLGPQLTQLMSDHSMAEINTGLGILFVLIFLSLAASYLCACFIARFSAPDKI